MLNKKSNNRISVNSEAYEAPKKQLPGAPIRQFDGSALLRPQKVQGSNLIAAGIIVLLAVAIGCILAYKAIDVTILSQERSIEQMEANATRDVKYSTPKLMNYVSKTDEGMIQIFKDKKYKTYFITESKGDGFEMVKFPGDMKQDEAEALFLEGIDNLEPADAGMLLNGMWRFSVDRSNTTDIRVRYADFKSGSVEDAIQKAVEYQGFADSKVTSNGTDESGNTYQEGSIKINKKGYTWRVSALPLSDVYAVDLPDTAVFVGVRLTRNA